ncbi:thaumatin [Choanephora cucurbitarum]|nr:thaumatin [Choanephora cucurbitarum]
MLLKTLAVSLLASLAMAAPSTNSTSASSTPTKSSSTDSSSVTNYLSLGKPTIYVVNNCDATLKVGSAVDVEYFGKTVDVSAGAKHTINPPVGWSGRVWGRINCSGDKCFESGMGSPATLAEFHFMEDGKVYYDISLVDGFNLPMVVTPTVKTDALTGSNNHWCTSTSCSSLPKCPSGFEVNDAKGKFAGCKSACTKFNTDEYCCTGNFNSGDTCTTNSYASAVKDACPEAYSYAYDDSTSVFMCTSNAYTVTIC